MKKALVSIAAVAFIALMITSVYATNGVIPEPEWCGCLCRGFTPGFWKHNIKVYLNLTNGKYSAFEGGPQDGVKLDDDMMEDLLDLIQAEGVLLGDYVPAFTDALGYLEGPGWSTDRTNTADWFNWAAGYGSYKG